MAGPSPCMTLTIGPY